MEVELIRYTEDAEDLCDKIAGTCYGKPYKDSPSLNHNRLRRVIESGHTSVLEHAVFTFRISDISRIVLAELTRHRIASYTVESTRYTSPIVCPAEGDTEGHTFPSEKGILDRLNENDRKTAESIMSTALMNSTMAYRILCEMGMSREDARVVLPMGTRTSLIMTINARSLYNFFNLRLCHRAYWEIQELAQKMYDLVNKVAPTIFSIKYCGPDCCRSSCNEAHSCGEPYCLPKDSKDTI